MSLSNKDRKFRAESRNQFPIDPAADTVASFASVIADALRRDFGTSPTKVKHIARLTGANVRTVQNWLYGRNGPSGAGLVVLMRHSDAVTQAVLELADRYEAQHAAQSSKLRGELRSLIKILLAHLGPE